MHMLMNSIIPLLHLYLFVQNIDVKSLLATYDISANTEIVGIKANGVKKLQIWHKSITWYK